MSLTTAQPRAAAAKAATAGFFSLLQDLWKNGVTVIRSAGIGVTIGVIPGVGEDIAAWISYAAAKRASRTPEDFGKGSRDGLIAAETANSAALPAAIIPALTLAVPGSAPAAVLIAAMFIHNVRPGPMIMFENPGFVSTVFGIIMLAKSRHRRSWTADDPAAPLDHRAAFERDGEGVGEQGLQPLRADALAPAGHGAAVERRRVLKEPLAAERLEVGGLDPGGTDRLVGQALHVLEDVQPRHQPGGQAWPADLVDEGLAAGRIELRPVNAPAQLRQLVPGVEDRLKGLAEHVGPRGGVGLGGAHRRGPHPVSSQ